MKIDFYENDDTLGNMYKKWKNGGGGACQVMLKFPFYP